MTRLDEVGLKLANGDDANAGSVRKLLLGPIEQAARGSTLCWRDQGRDLLKDDAFGQ